VFQYLHLLAANDYDRKIQGPKNNGQGPYIHAGVAKTQSKADKAKGGAFATGPLRDLAILTGGTHAGIFNVRAKLFNKTLVVHQQQWREDGYSIEYLSGGLAYTIA
jgi:hypothetical protein